MRKQQPMQGFLFFCLVIYISFAIGGCQPQGYEHPSQTPTTQTGKAAIGGPYSLISHTGQTLTQNHFLGQPQMLYFGFTFCPDVCPTALIQMGAAQTALGQDGQAIHYIFISVDPERDTPEKLAQYVHAAPFPEGLIGLTGNIEQIEQVKQAFKVYAAKARDPQSAAGYMIDHTSLIYLMDAQGNFVTAFSHQSPLEDIVRESRKLLSSN